MECYGDEVFSGYAMFKTYLFFKIFAHIMEANIMINKKAVENKISEAIEIAKKYSLSSMEKDLFALREESDKFRVHVLMIGGFSAGKSALLNQFIGKAVLEENIAPETALATELYFSENERVIANYLNGKRVEVDVDEALNTDDVKNLEYYLNSENLKMHPDYIIVDTPGFDSGIERHNKALMQYVDEGTAFFLVVDCEKGTISESALNFMNEASHYSGDIAVIINKCDKKIPGEVQEIKSHIEKVLFASCGQEFPVICTSIKDLEVDKKLVELLNEFDPQYLYDKNVGTLIDRKRGAIQDALALLKEKEVCEISDYDEEIEKREAAKKSLLKQIETEKKRVSTKLHSEVKNRIMNSINVQLVSNVEVLASAYKGGIEPFKNQIIEIIRPILICEVEEYSNIAYEDLVKHLNLDCLRQSNDIDQISDILSNVYEKLKIFEDNQNIFVPSLGVDSDEANKGIGVYRGLTSILAIATEVINPIVELVLVFLPDILKVVKSFLGLSGNQQLVDAIQNKVIPQILEKLRTELDKVLIQVENIMVENIENSIGEIIHVENEALEMAKNKKNSAVHEYEQFLSDIQQDIELLRE